MRGLVAGLPNPYPLVSSLPALYQGEPFTERFLSVFDDTIAPLLSTLDTFDSYLDPALCPPDFLGWLGGWVGLELDENWAEDQQRRLVATAVDLFSWRGTRRGMTELIQSFLGMEQDRIEVEDSGGAAWSATPGGTIPGDPRPMLRVRVRVDNPDEVDERRLERLVVMSLPAHVAHEVEIVTP